MATHSSILAWEIPRTEEPGGLQSMGSQRAGHHGSYVAQPSTYRRKADVWLPGTGGGEKWRMTVSWVPVLFGVMKMVKTRQW